MTAAPDGLDWTQHAFDQLDWHYRYFARPRLDGLTDDEYRWRPVEPCWDLRPRPDGTLELEYDVPEPVPPPVTTIAWRLGHLIVSTVGMRAASHFGAAPIHWETHPYAATAEEALTQLDTVYAAWAKGVSAMTPEAAARPVGPAEGPWADTALFGLVMHINREMIHHLAEIALLRDLYRERFGDAVDREQRRTS